MKNLLFAVSAIAALFLLAPGAGFAQGGFSNEVGLYLNPAGTGGSGTFEVSVPVDVFLVLTKPTDVEDGDSPYSTINSFGCTLNFTPIPNDNLVVMGESLALSAFNAGDSSDINQGFLEYIVGMSSPVPVTNEAALLVAFTFMNLDPVTTAVTLSPSSSDAIVGQMFFQSEVGQPRIMYSVGGSQEAAVFLFNGEAVDVEDESFGSVKALFR